MGTRTVPFSRELYIEADDFMEDAPKKFFRLAPGREVRLRYAYFITCTEVVKDAAGNIIELRCTYDPATRGGNAPDGRKVKGTIHWVSAAHAVTAEMRAVRSPVQDRVSRTMRRKAKRSSTTSIPIRSQSFATPSSNRRWQPPSPAQHFQFERLGYFFTDPVDSQTGQAGLQSHGDAARYLGQRGGKRVKQNDGIVLPASAEILRAHYNAAATTNRTAA